MRQNDEARNNRGWSVFRVVFYAAMETLALSAQAASAGWPEKPVRIVVPSSAGGAIDSQARLLAESFRVIARQPFLIDNRPGAGTLIGTEMVVASPPDGYTVLFNSANIAIIPTLYAGRTKFNATKDLAPVSLVSSATQVLITHPNVPAKSVMELVALARKKPGLLKQGVNTPGSTSHLSAEMLIQLAGIDTPIVPFKSSSFAMTSLLSGEIDLLYASAPVALPFIPSGRVRALAVTSVKRSSVLPDLPTMNTFYPGFESDNWYAMFYPANTPMPIVDMLNRMIVTALKEERVRQFMKSNAVDAMGGSPEELSKYLERQVATYAEVIRKGKIGLR